jgi:hypothetical protein
MVLYLQIAPETVLAWPGNLLGLVGSGVVLFVIV